MIKKSKKRKKRYHRAERDGEMGRETSCNDDDLKKKKAKETMGVGVGWSNSVI